MNTAAETSVDLQGRVALVTGGGRGIGRAIALGLGRAGAAVAVLARTPAELAQTTAALTEAGGEACAVVADVTDAAAVARAIGEAEARLGAIDVLVNNAGVIGPIAPFAETDPDAWWRSAEVNLRGPMLMSRAVLPGMIARGRGRIINLVTGSAAFPYFSSYAAAKTALVRFSECLAAELRPHGLAVFPMGPGTVRTAMSEHSLNSDEGKRWIPWFRRIFDEGLDLPAERPAELAVRLASGRYDRLSGLTLSPYDDLDEIFARFDRVEAEQLYSLRLRALPNPQLDRVMSVREAGTRVEPRGLSLERTIRAPRGQVYAAWIDAAAMAIWFLPEGGPARWIRPPTVEPRPGGRIAVDVVSGDGEFHIVGRFGELAPDARLVFRWSWDAAFPLGGPADTEVTVAFEDDDDDTRIVLRHTGLPTAAARDAHERGWNRCFDGLARLLEPVRAR